MCTHTHALTSSKTFDSCDGDTRRKQRLKIKEEEQVENQLGAKI